MSLIEGIGDDFLYAFGLLAFVGIVSLAWFSTHVNHLQFPTTLFIIERRTRRRNDDESERTSPARPSPESIPSNDLAASASSGNETQTEHESDVESSEVDEYNSEPTPIAPEIIQTRVEPPQCPSIHDQPAAPETTDDQPLSIVIKFLNDTQKAISAHPNDSISKIKQLNFADELASNKLVRFIYQGRELQDTETLRTCNIRDQTIIHCQISVRRHEPSSHRLDGMPTAPHLHGNGFDASVFIDAAPINLSSHFVLLLSAVLAAVWYLRIKYRLLFSPISTIALVLITMIFLIFTCGSLLSRRRTMSNGGSTATIAIAPIAHAHLD